MQATSNIEFKYNGKVYQTVPEITVRDRCKGCVFDEDEEGCSEATITHGCRNIIWQEKQGTVKESEPSVLTWTLEEIESWYTVWVENVYPFSDVKKGLIEMKREALRKQDPEYQKYLELKAKFEATA